MPDRWQVCAQCPALVSHRLDRCPECGSRNLIQDPEAVDLVRRFLIEHAADGPLQMRLRYRNGAEHRFVPRCVQALRAPLKRGGLALLALGAHLPPWLLAA
jgi:hypothetical protein